MASACSTLGRLQVRGGEGFGAGSGGADEPGPGEVGVLERRALDVDDAVGPEGHLEEEPHALVQLMGAQEQDVEVLPGPAWCDREGKGKGVGDLELGVGVELIEEVHDLLGVEG